MPDHSASTWLSNDPDYGSLIKDLCASDPRLIQRDRKSLRRRTPWPIPCMRVISLDARLQDPFGEPVPFHNAESLQLHLKNLRRNEENNKGIIVVEGLSPAFIDVLGTHFDIPPSFFADHERECEDARDLIALPTAVAAQEYVTIKYGEIIHLDEKVRGKFCLFCADTARYLSVTRSLGQFSDVGVLERNCSVWRRARENGGWDCVVLTDPPLRRVRSSYESLETVEVSCHPFEGGYLDFVPSASQRRVRKGPPRTSMLDDICFYATNHLDQFDQGSPDAVLRLALKIIASHCRKHTEYLNQLIQTTMSAMTRLDKLDVFSIESVEKQWSDSIELKRRLVRYCAWIEAIMIQCRVPIALPNTKDMGSWDSIDVDLQFLYAQFKDIQHRANLLGDSITGLAGIAGNRQALVEQSLSRQEARSVKALTFVGLVFIPLGYTAALFGMQEPYGPLNEKFWVHFAVSLPLVIAVLATYHVLQYTQALGRDGERRIGHLIRVHDFSGKKVSESGC